MKIVKCKSCSDKIEKNDYTALNKKLLGRNIKEFFCLKCLADHLNCEEEDLKIKIEEFKEQGCNLF